MRFAEKMETSGDRLLDDLIYSFLLQSDFPRASIVFNIDLLESASQAPSGVSAPSFIIVDPETARPLAVIEVVDAVDGEALKQAAIETGAYASRMTDKAIQGYLIRVDVRGRTESEQVQFYRIWPNSTLQTLSSKSFPDLETLRVSQKLIENNLSGMDPRASLPSSASVSQAKNGEEYGQGPGAGLYLPALILVLLMLFDGIFTSMRGSPGLTLPQSILASGAAALLTLPAAIRYFRR